MTLHLRNCVAFLIARATTPMLTALLFFGGCSPQTAVQTETIGDLGRFEFHTPGERMDGVMIGAPHGAMDPVSADYARWISDQTGAGLAIAYGFKAKRISVAQPLVSPGVNLNTAEDPARRGNVYREFRALLQKTTKGNLEFYVGIRFADAGVNADVIEAAFNGFTIEEIKLLKGRFTSLRDRALRGSRAPRIDIALDPVDKLSWRVAGLKHHGVLISAEKGLSLRLPRRLATNSAKLMYRDVLARWVEWAHDLALGNPSIVPQMQVWRCEYGRIDYISSRKSIRGVVIGAPHGTFDEHTAEFAKRIAYDTGIGAVIAKGFTPTESGDGWRINVNRPTERRYPAAEIEIATPRAKEIYEKFKSRVFAAAGGPLNLYIDIHQNGRQPNIEVATVGISKQQAQVIKDAYRAVSGRYIGNPLPVGLVDLLVEPLDKIEIGAWATKTSGILSEARQGVHFELPVARVMWNPELRALYMGILSELIGRLPAILQVPALGPEQFQTELDLVDAARSAAPATD